MALTKAYNRMIEGAPVNVKDFGAVGDGVTDDTAAIQAAIDSFGSDPIHLFIPAGTYKVTSALTVTTGSSYLFGEGRATKIVGYGAINILEIGDGVVAVNFGTLTDIAIYDGDGAVLRGIWGRLLRNFHFNNIVLRGMSDAVRGFYTAGFQIDYSWSCNLSSVICFWYTGIGFWMGNDPATASNQLNDCVFNGCQVYNGDGIGYKITGSGNTFNGCLAENCTAGGMYLSYVPGLKISGGYFENNGGAGGYAITITNNTNAGCISGSFINNSSLANSKLIAIDTTDVFSVIGCNLRLQGSGSYGVYAGATTSSITAIGNKNEGGGGALYGGASYPSEFIQTNDRLKVNRDLVAHDFTTDYDNKTVYAGRLSGTPGDNSKFIVRSRDGSIVFKADASVAEISSVYAYSTVVGATNRDLYVDDTGVIGYVSSTRASKANITPITDVSWLLNLNPQSFNRRKIENIFDENGEKTGFKYLDDTFNETEYGLIAEEVESIQPELCFYNEEGELAGVHYHKLVVPLLKMVMELKAEVDIIKKK